MSEERRMPSEIVREIVNYLLMRDSDMGYVTTTQIARDLNLNYNSCVKYLELLMFIQKHIKIDVITVQTSSKKRGKKKIYRIKASSLLSDNDKRDK